MAEQFTGTVEILNSESGQPVIVLEGGDDERGGNLLLGGNGQDGDFVVADSQGRPRISMNGDTCDARFQSPSGASTIVLDGQRGDGRFAGKGSFTGTVEVLNTDSGKPTIVFEGGDDERGGNLSLGGNGQDGDFTINDASGRQRIYMNGDSSEARFERSDGTITLVLDGQRGEIRLRDWSIAVPDYVFEPDYQLPTLESLREFVTTNHHLPEVPPASEIVKDGLSVGRLSMVLLKKLEETLLYLIRQDRLLQEQQGRLARLEAAFGRMV